MSLLDNEQSPPSRRALSLAAVYSQALEDNLGRWQGSYAGLGEYLIGGDDLAAATHLVQLDLVDDLGAARLKVAKALIDRLEFLLHLVIHSDLREFRF